MCLASPGPADGDADGGAGPRVVQVGEAGAVLRRVGLRGARAGRVRRQHAAAGVARLAGHEQPQHAHQVLVEGQVDPGVDAAVEAEEQREDGHVAALCKHTAG